MPGELLHSLCLGSVSTQLHRRATDGSIRFEQARLTRNAAATGGHGCRGAAAARGIVPSTHEPGVGYDMIPPRVLAGIWL